MLDINKKYSNLKEFQKQTSYQLIKMIINPKLHKSLFQVSISLLKERNFKFDYDYLNDKMTIIKKVYEIENGEYCYYLSEYVISNFYSTNKKSKLLKKVIFKRSKS